MMTQSVPVKFWHTHLPAMSYVFPEPQNIVDIDPTDIKMNILCPVTITQRKKNMKLCEHSKAITEY